MKCLWPSTKGVLYALGTALLLAAVGVVVAWDEVRAASKIDPNPAPLTQREKILRRLPVHISEFSLVERTSPQPKCGNVSPPEALLTPDPLLHVQDEDLHVRVSFIVGADGRVHSALILDSGGPIEDQVVLRAVRDWRYRPALCNGVPSDAEALVRFSLR
jgi:TonB family protein